MMNNRHLVFYKVRTHISTFNGLVLLLLTTICLGCNDSNVQPVCTVDNSILFAVDSLDFYSDCVKDLTVSNDTIDSEVLGHDFPKLKELFIDNCYVTNWDTLLFQISKQKALKKVMLRIGSQPLPTSVSLLRNIEDLALFLDSSSQLCEGLFSLRQLKRLYIESDFFDEKDSRLNQLDSLSELALSCQLKRVPNVIFEMKHLEYLNLSFNPDLADIPSDLSQLSNLKRIELRNTKISDLAWDEIKATKKTALLEKIEKNCHGCSVVTNISSYK